VAESGLCIDPGRPYLLLELLKALSTDEPLKMKLMSDARSRAVNHYSWGAITDKYLSLLQAARS